MSVLRCNRRGCDGIMCGRLSRTFGYICGECFEELVKYLLAQGQKYVAATGNIGTFMSSTKRAKHPLAGFDTEANVRDQLEREFSGGGH